MTILACHELQKLVRTIPDYPQPGIMFRDITTLISDPNGFKSAVVLLADRYRDMKLTFVAGIEARGFIFGSAVALELEVGFLPIRKKGKLPFKTIGEDYQLEYGMDRIEIHQDAITPGDNVLLLDDLIATGGTAAAGIDLIRRAGGVVDHAAFVIDLPDLGGANIVRSKEVDVYTLIEFEGD